MSCTSDDKPGGVWKISWTCRLKSESHRVAHIAAPFKCIWCIESSSSTNNIASHTYSCCPPAPPFWKYYIAPVILTYPWNIVISQISVTSVIMVFDKDLQNPIIMANNPQGTVIMESWVLWDYNLAILLLTTIYCTCNNDLPLYLLKHHYISIASLYCNYSPW